LLPEDLKVDGNRDFVNQFVPQFIRPGARLVDVGGGKQPYLGVRTKSSLGVHVTGLDISQEELDQAPVGAYDATICADISTYRGVNDADIIVCQAVLEHVRSVEGAFEAFASMLKPEGLALIFLPSRNAVYARLNLLLPDALKRKILFYVFPKSKKAQGFTSYYDRCTPREFQRLAKQHGFRVEVQRLYYTSSYFSCFFPIHLLWRMWVLLFRAADKLQAAETFSMALRKT
jgi:2-polyprenyl-3-methyl-5-hydroxy-6-metoxy-1,4-benzoquinol methylase